MESIKDYENKSTSFYFKEIVPYAVERKLFKIEDTGRLGKSAVQLGMGKIEAKTSVGKYFVEFFNKATIHGLNHIVAPHRHFVERILTINFVGVALACSVISSCYYWSQYQTKPTSITFDFDQKNYRIVKPALTVCVEEKISPDKFTEVFNAHGVEDTQLARNFFSFISNASYFDMSDTPIYNGTSSDKWLNIISDLYVDLDIRSCQDEMCTTANVSSTNIVTETGICTTLFSPYSVYSTHDYWLSDNWTIIPETLLPDTTYTERNTARLTVFNILQRYKMTFHHPRELAKYGDPAVDMDVMGMTDIKVGIRQLDSSEDLRKLSPRQRQCYYPEDRKLKTTPVYTQNFCLMECRFDIIKSKCGCYPHFVRPVSGVSICNATQLRCIGNWSNVILTLKNGDERLCECPQACSLTIYTMIFSRTSGFFVNTGDVGVMIEDRTANIELQFPYYKLRREVFFGFTDFLVSVGGASGLFLGASIISFVEIIYYATLRLFWYKMSNFKYRKD